MFTKCTLLSNIFEKNKINTLSLNLFCNSAAQRVILFTFKLSFTLVSNIKPQYLETYSICLQADRCPTEDKSVYLVNKANLVHNLFLGYLFLVYLSVSTCFGPLCAHHQEKQLCLCDTCYVLFCVGDCLVRRVTLINILRIKWAPSWLYLQAYAGLHDQQNIKHKINLFIFSLSGDSKLELISEILKSLYWN